MTYKYNAPRQMMMNHTGDANDANPLYVTPTATCSLAILLDRISTWLLCYAYGAYRETVTCRAKALADVIALTVYVNAIMPVPVSFDAAGEDLSARRMLDAAAFLMPACCMSLTTFPASAAHIDIATAPRDRNTSVLAEWPLLPALAVSDRGTAVALYRDLLKDACERRPSILCNGKTPVCVVQSVAQMAGGIWSTVASLLLKPERLSPTGGEVMTDER